MKTSLQAINKSRRTDSAQQGFTLIELMIAMLIGSFLIIGAITVYSQSSTNYRVSESIARLQENARFALSMLEPDFRLVKNWGRHNEPALITIDPAIAITCQTGGNDVTAWALNLAVGIAATDDNPVAPNPNLPCPPDTAIQPNTDVFVLRHGTAQIMPFAPGQVQLQSNRVSGVLFDDGLMPAGYLVANSTTHNLVIDTYYIDTGSSLGPTIPSLRRQVLVNGGQIQDQEIMPGVENMQIQFGVDTDADGNVERYVDSDHAIVTPGSGAFIPTAEMVSVRVWLLLRAEFPENGHNDPGPYTPLDGNLAQITPNDQFRRMVVSKTIFLRNAKG